MNDSKIRELLAGAGYDADSVQHVLHAAGYVIVPSPGTVLSPAERRLVDHRVTEESDNRYGPPGMARALDDAVELAVELYETTARHGCPRELLDYVTSFAAVAVDAISARDFRRSQGKV